MSTLQTSFYDGPALIDRVRDALREAELDPTRLRVEDLAGMDQFHALGLAATLALAKLAELRPGERVLDIGAGIAGPARVLAARFGARVTAVEPLERFRDLAAMLNGATGLDHAIELVDAHGAALPFADASFDLVWTQAVLPTVADVGAFAAEAQRVLAPGGRWALAETVAGPGGELHFPVPLGRRPGRQPPARPRGVPRGARTPGLRRGDLGDRARRARARRRRGRRPGRGARAARQSRPADARPRCAHGRPRAQRRRTAHRSRAGRAAPLALSTRRTGPAAGRAPRLLPRCEEHGTRTVRRARAAAARRGTGGLSHRRALSSAAERAVRVA